MEVEKMKRKTIQRLKEIRDEQGLTITQITDLLERQGKFVSESTLKKIFADGSEDMNFRYQDSIAPVAEVLMDIYGDTSGLEDAESLRQIIHEKNKLIEFILIKLEEKELESQNREKLYQDRKDAFERTITALESQVKHLQEQLIRKEDAIERKDDLLEGLIKEYLHNKNKT